MSTYEFEVFLLAILHLSTNYQAPILLYFRNMLYYPLINSTILHAFNISDFDLFYFLILQISITKIILVL